MKSYSITDYVNAGCEEMNAPAMVAMVTIANGKVCDTGCYAFSSGNCKAYKRLITENKTPSSPPETVKEEAKRRGVSINEVRRQRRDTIYSSTVR